MIIELDENNFKENINHGLKLVVFTAEWCSYCIKEHDVLKQLDDIWIGNINGDKNQNLIKEYGIMGFPTFLLFKNGQVLTKFSGFRNKSELINIISQYI